MLKREKNHIIASKYGCEDSVFACILHAQGQKFSEKRYGTLTPDLTELRDTPVAYGLWQGSDGKYRYLFFY